MSGSTCRSEASSNLASKVSKLCCVSATEVVGRGSSPGTVTEDGASSSTSGTVSRIVLLLSFVVKPLSSVVFPSVSSPALALSKVRSSAAGVFSNNDIDRTGALSLRPFGRQARFLLGAFASSGISTVKPLLKGHGVTSYRKTLESASFIATTSFLSSSVSFGSSMR